MSAKNNKKRLKKIAIEVFLILIILIILIIGYLNPNIQEVINGINQNQTKSAISYNIGEIPEYDGKSYIIINNNKPNFDKNDYTTKSFERYSELDKLGRCGVAYANICKETMPKDNEEREGLDYEPTGWNQEKYKDIVDGGYLYNRCHLIGWQLSAENDNKLNLITGTRYMNTEGMLQFENKVADYLNKDENEENHVLYRVTPIFEGDNLLASGVQMEAYSVEDNGKGICFNVYVYNVQPGIVIDYKNGVSHLDRELHNI